MLTLTCLFSCTPNEFFEEDKSTNYELISDDNLQDWEVGVMSDSFILLAGSNKDNYYYLIRNKSDIGDDDFLLFKFNSAGLLEEISNHDNCINIAQHESELDLNWFTSNGELCGTILNIHLPTITVINNSRADLTSWLDPNNLATIGDIIQNFISLSELGHDLFNSDQVKFIKDMQKIGLDGLLNLAPQPAGLILSSLKAMIDGLNEDLYKRQRNAMYGNCEISIADIINDEKGNLNVFVSIQNANSVPSHLYHLYYDEPEDVTKNTVYWGIVGQNNFVPYKNNYTSPYSTLKVLDTSNEKTQNFMISYPIPQKGEKFYFRAFLLSTRLSKSVESVNDNHILYSDNYIYNSLNAYITDFSQHSNEVKGETVSIEANVSGFINSIENVSEWGFYYLDDNGKYTYFPSDYSFSNPTYTSGISSPNEYSGKIRINTIKSSFVNKHKTIKLGIYTKDFNFVYNEWSQPQTFEIHYNDEMPNLTVYYDSLECNYLKNNDFNVKLCGEVLLNNDESALGELEESFISWNMKDGTSLFVQKLSNSKKQNFSLQNSANSTLFTINYAQYSASLTLYPQYHCKFRNEGKTHITDLSPVCISYQEQPFVEITDGQILNTSQNVVEGLGWFYVTNFKLKVKSGGLFWIKDMCFQVDGSDGWNNCFASHPTADVPSFYETTRYQYYHDVETERVGYYIINLYGGKQIRSVNSIILNGNPIDELYVM